MRIVIGIPMYGGAHGLAVRSLLSLQNRLIENHIVEFDIVVNGANLPKVRNGIVERFLDGESDVLVFIDSDMVFSAEDIEKIATAPFDVSVINYRKKCQETQWNATGSMGLVHNGDNWLKTELAGTGLMAMSREALKTVKAAHPFPFEFTVADGLEVGEDYTFCKRLTALGGQIFILADAYAAHIGDTYYGGNYHDYLKGQSNGIS